MLWLDNLASFSMQIALLAAVGLILPAALRLRLPRVLLIYLQVLLAVCLALPLLQPWKLRLSSATTGVTFGAPESSGPSFVATGASFRFAETLLLVLAIGAALRILWLLVGLVRLRCYRKNARAAESLPPAVEDIQSRIGVRPRFYVSAGISGPFTFGLRRPVVLLPDSFLKMDPRSQEAVVCHELLHVQRRDWVFTLCEELIRAVFWFHPVLWWLIERIRLTREQVVDNLVIGWTRARKHYVQSLLAMAAAPARAGFAAPSFVRKHHLAERVTLLLKEAPMSRPRLITSLITIFVALTLAGGLALRSFPLEIAVQEQPAKPIPRAGGTYKVSGETTGASLLHKVEPEYTEEARNARIEGTVVLSVEITPEGKADNVRVSKSLDQGLDQKALEAVRQWRFRPPFKDGKPVRAKASIEVNFRLFKDRPAEAKPAAAEEEKKVYRLRDGVIAPQLVSKVEPAYTEEARDAKVEGTVVLSCVVNPEGQTEDIKILESLDPGLDEKAMEAVRQWKFDPGVKDGKPVRVAATIEINFRLL